MDAVSCSLQCRRLEGRRGDRKENSTIFYPFPLVLSTFPPVTLVFTLDIPPILLSLKKSKMASADKLNDHSPENYACTTGYLSCGGTPGTPGYVLVKRKVIKSEMLL